MGLPALDPTKRDLEIVEDGIKGPTLDHIRHLTFSQHTSFAMLSAAVAGLALTQGYVGGINARSAVRAQPQVRRHLIEREGRSPAAAAERVPRRFC